MASVSEKMKGMFPDLVWTPLPSPDKHPLYKYHGFHPGKTTILPRGHVKQPGYQAFCVDVAWEQDVAIEMRDGVKIYADIFRPANDGTKVPAMIPWSPYGKVGAGVLGYDAMGPWRMGIPYSKLSGYETFEGPNPADWCERGYAIVDVDSRGAQNSEGNLHFWGEQEAVDVYDTITWAANQPWCNGSVVMMGNSWLAVAQINFASRFEHPNLKAIAPWEAFTDCYDHMLCRGGISTNNAFGKMIIHGQAGPGSIENVGEMLQKRPLMDEYWDTKRMDVSKIKDLPVYLTASYSTILHCEGSFTTFEKAQTPRKWLRVHNSQEWHDLYRTEAVNDLQRFFDFYAKGIQNGWEKDTPRVRLSLLGYESSLAHDVVERPEEQWPLARQHMQKFHLDATSNSLALDRPKTSSSASHEAHSLSASSDFKLVFNRYTELSGRPYAKLHMSCAESDEMDICIQIRKISVNGDLLESINWKPMPKPAPEVPDVNVAKHVGQQGMLRASHHVSLATNPDSDEFPIYDHRTQQPIPAGTVVPLLIPIWPVGLVFEAGEGLMLRVAGHDLAHPEAEVLRSKEPTDGNVGKHTVHTGGDHDSYLMLPFITE